MIVAAAEQMKLRVGEKVSLIHPKTLNLDLKLFIYLVEFILPDSRLCLVLKANQSILAGTLLFVYSKY
jgi:hypothetical protein